MSLSAEAVSSLLGLLYEASASPEQWPTFFAALSECAQVKASYFVLVDAEDRCRLALNPGFDPSWGRSYTEFFHRRDILLHRFVAAKQAHGDWIGTSQSVISDQEYRSSPFYNEYLRPQGLLHHCAAALGGLDGSIQGGVGMLRDPREQPFDKDTVTLLTMLAPHLKRALNTQHALSLERNRIEELKMGADSLGMGIIDLDTSRRVTRMTAPALAILEARNGLALEDGFLRAAVPSEQRRLSELVAGALATGSGRGTESPVQCSTAAAPQAGNGPVWTAPSGGAMLITRRPPSRPLRLIVTPFKSSQVFLDTRAAAMVFLSDPDAQPASRAEILHALYGLTPTECRLADLLAQGHKLSAAAERLHMATGTARFHLKVVLRKTGAGRQAELMRLMAGLPGGWPGIVKA
jgi:DNA-binding CsgD family transcriptional regulator